jgi:hypothetical protein
MNEDYKDLLKRLEEIIDLGHEKRNMAFLRQVTQLCQSPGASAPQGAGKKTSKQALADLLAFYRFVDNENVRLADMRDSRARVVLDSVTPGDDLVVIHDVTVLDYSPTLPVKRIAHVPIGAQGQIIPAAPELPMHSFQDFYAPVLGRDFIGRGLGMESRLKINVIIH